ncbi:MAG: O-antigen ligase family protein [Candidatus Hodarchaeota archaeon]
MGWLIIAFFPLSYASYATFVPSAFFPMNSIRIAFAVTIGIILSNRDYNSSPQRVLKLISVKIIMLFLIMIFLVSYNERLMPLISNYIPGFMFAIILPFILIKDIHDLDKLVRIMCWQAAIIGMLIIVEYISEFNIYDYFAKINEDSFGMYEYEKEILYRSGYKRVAGLGGNAVDTAYLLVFYFPLTLWYSFKKRFFFKLPILFTIIGLILLQTRAAFIALGIIFVFLVYENLIIRYKNSNNRSILFKSFVIIAFSMMLISIIYPDIVTMLERFFQGMFTDYKGYGIDEKIDRIPIAINYILSNPLTGYGSPSHVYYEVMRTADIPSPIIYFLSGGVFLGLVYLSMIISIIFSTRKLIRYYVYKTNDIQLLIMITACLIAGFVVVFSNWREKHFLTMFILFISTMKVFVFNRHFKKSTEAT